MIIFDLDGTLADITHRLHFIQKEPKDWDGFFAACVADKPIAHTIEIMNILMNRDRVEIWTGRSDIVREETIRWLDIYGRPRSFDKFIPLKMRPHGDHCPDEVLKKRWLDDLDEKPTLVFDDRDRMVKMWRDNGIPCFQVAPGDF